jgi:DNA-binding HxlR family transcriptional regulator
MARAGKNAGVTGTGLAADPRLHRCWTPLARALAATGDDWTLMIVVALAPGRMRLRGLQRALPGVSTGVLERYVQQMVSLGLLRRWRFKEMPPRVELELTAAGLELVPIAAALLRWGHRHVWTAAREREHVDVLALLCLLPILLEGHRLPDGALEAVARERGAEPSRRVFPISDGRMGWHDEHLTAGTARIEGWRSAWIAALGPDSDQDRLSCSGEAHLGTAVLEALKG